MADGQRVLLKDLDGPHGLALQDGWLYVAERSAVGRVRFDQASGQLAGNYEYLLTGLTKDGQHTTRTIGIGPDGRLYLSQGSTCNVCDEKDPRRATMMRLEPDGTGGEIHATGLRNSVGFDWAPWNGALYATDNGRDLLGDDFPPDELNRIERGAFYGWPYVNGFNVVDPDLGGPILGRGTANRSAARLPRAQRATRHRVPARGRSRPGTSARRSSRCTARGTARCPTATRSCRCTGATTARSTSRFPDRLSQSRRHHRPAGVRRRRAGRRDLRGRRLRGRDLPRRAMTAPDRPMSKRQARLFHRPGTPLPRMRPPDRGLPLQAQQAGAAAGSRCRKATASCASAARPRAARARA